MALPVGGGDEYPPLRLTDGPYYSAKRRTADTVDHDHQNHARHKRPKYAQQPQYADHVAYKAADELPPLALYHPSPCHSYRHSSPHPHLPSPELSCAAPAMERTASGHSIQAEATERCGSTELLEDGEAAQRVRDHLASFRRRNPDSKHERILRSIISPRRPCRTGARSQCSSSSRARDDEYPLDNDSLESIFSAANEIFFNGRLSQRVRWDWSHESSTRYENRVIGTTALRRACKSIRGFETLIVLSSTILQDERFSRRLLISTFLHELIHSYLFICCGFRARWCGGHTPGFRAIAQIIDDWAGEESGLYLSRVEADLDLFRLDRAPADQGGDSSWSGVFRVAGKSFTVAANVYSCSGMAPEHDEYPATADVVQTVPSDHERVPYLLSRVPPGLGQAVGTWEMASCYEHSGSNGGNNAWWSHHQAARPLYIYAGDGSATPYVYTNTNSMLQRP